MKTLHYLSAVIILIGFCTISSGQEYAVDQGASFISGTASFSSNSGDLFNDADNHSYTTVTLSPTFNYFVAKNFFIGGGLELQSQTQGDISISSTGIGPQIGVAIGKSNSTVFPFLNLGLRYYSMSANYGSLGNSSTSGTDVILGFGVLVPVKTHIGLSIGGEYHSLSLKNSGVRTSGNIFSLGIGIVGLLF